MSMGTIEPERISEIVSDVVESDTGYLDVRFDVPSGGAFRVMDVIVAEAPALQNIVHRPPATLAGNLLVYPEISSFRPNLTANCPPLRQHVTNLPPDLSYDWRHVCGSPCDYHSVN